MNTTSGYIDQLDSIDLPKAQLVMYAFDRVEDFSTYYQVLRNKFPVADIIGFSTAGHFVDEKINDQKGVFSAVEFSHSAVKSISFNIKDFDSSAALGKAIGEKFKEFDQVKGISVISDGGLVNGTELIAEVNKGIASDIPLFGGMAGDQARFESTFVGLNEVPTNGNVVVTAYIGEKLEVKTGCQDGWNEMGVDFTITKSDKNVLIELDDKNAYDTLHSLLEPKDQAEFNKNTLYYPFQLKQSDEIEVIRTPIFVDHENKTITYAGNMPEGKKVSLMKTGTMDLLDSTMSAAQNAFNENGQNTFVLAVSCVGRRVVLDDLVNEEYAEINGVFNENANILGFYSYGEFARGENGYRHCMLHNQTFTIAAINELD